MPRARLSICRQTPPDLSYDDLVIVDGLLASVEIVRLLFVAGKILPGEHDRIREDLLSYCERDTWAMVKLLESLHGLADA
jgi:hypothetical protein